MKPRYQNPGPDSASINTLTGFAVLEFGAPWCPICQGAQAAIEGALAQFPEVRRIMVEDGPGRPLGRSFRIKLWPTLIFLHHGQEVTRLVRPETQAPIEQALQMLLADPTPSRPV